MAYSLINDCKDKAVGTDGTIYISVAGRFKFSGCYEPARGIVDILLIRRDTWLIANRLEVMACASFGAAWEGAQL